MALKSCELRSEVEELREILDAIIEGLGLVVDVDEGVVWFRKGGKMYDRFVAHRERAERLYTYLGVAPHNEPAKKTARPLTN